MPRATINGHTQEFTEDTTILHAARSLGIEIPTLCHDDRLKPAGACRLCVVSIKGWPHLAVACHMPLADGMEIDTESREAREERRGVLSLLIAIRETPSLTPSIKSAVRVAKL